MSTQISDAVDKLIEDRVIDLQVDTFVPEGEDTKSVISSRDRAVAEVRAMITDAFFTSSIDPQRDRPDGWDKATDLIENVGMFAVGGSGLTPHFSYNKTHYSRIDSKRLDVNMSERVTVRRTINPQGHLTGIAAAIRDSGLPRTPTFVNDIDLDDPWFKRRRVRVISRVDTSTGHVSSVDAELTYHNDVQTVVIDGPNVTQQVDWASVVENGRMDMPVQGSAVVHLTTLEDLERPTTLTAPAETIDSEVWEVRTDDLFRLDTIPIRAEEVPWDRWSSLEVTVRYDDPDHKVHQQSTIELSATTPGWNYVLFRMPDSPASLDYRVRYLGAGGRQDYLRDWTTSDEGEIRIRDPFPSEADALRAAAGELGRGRPAARRPQLRRPGPRRAVRPVHGVHERGQGQPDLQRRPPGSAAATGPVAGHRVVHRRARRRRRTLMTTETRLLIRPDMPRHTVVMVTADLAGAQDAGLKDVVVKVSPVDSDTVLAELTFVPGGPPQEFGIDHTDDIASYRYSVTWHYTNGMSRTKDLTEAQSADLTVGLA